MSFYLDAASILSPLPKQSEQPVYPQIVPVGRFSFRSIFFRTRVSTRFRIATVLLLFVILVFMKGSSGAIALFPIVLGAYTVVSYYTDRWVYERRQRKKAREGKAQTR